MLELRYAIFEVNRLLEQVGSESNSSPCLRHKNFVLNQNVLYFFGYDENYQLS